MVCSKCEKKLQRGIHQEMWKEGSRHTIEGGGRAVNENKALSARKRWTPYGAGANGAKCRICKQSLHQEGIYCQKCAYARGQCSMCGVKVWDTTYHNVGGVRDPTEESGDGAPAGGAKPTPDDTEGAGEPTDAPEDENAAEKARETEAAAAAAAAERRRATSEAVASNRLAGPTSLASAAREIATAATGATVTGWQYDSGSGYYYDVETQTYYDPKTKKYFDCKTQKWVSSEAPTAAEMATGAKSGSFTKGTRKPDRFGL